MRALFLLFLCCVSGFAFAHPEPDRFNEVELQAEVSREVQNDVLHVTLYAEFNETNPADLADKLNRVANDALKAAAEFKTVKTRSGSSHSYPVYDRNTKLTGWRGRSEIRLESRDFAAAAKLIGKLQSTMQLGGMHFDVSPESRRKIEQELMQQAVAAFRERAQVLTQALGSKSYKIRKLSVNTGGGAVPMPRNYEMRAAKADAVTAPVLEGGTTQIQVTTNGSIQVE